MAEVTERELFIRLIDALTAARESCRGLGLHRNDERWIRVAGLMDQTKDNATRLMKARSPASRPRLWLPPMRTN